MRKAALTIIAGLLLIGSGPAQAAENRSVPEQPSERAVAWNGARLTEPGSGVLEVQFWGWPSSCGVTGHYATTRRSPDGIVVTVHEETHVDVDDDPAVCPDMALRRTLRVVLPDDPTDGTVIDGATGEARPVFDVAALRVLPRDLRDDGYEFRNETISGATNDTRWSKGGGHLFVRIKDRLPMEHYQPGPDDERIRRTTINGYPATVWRLGLSGFRMLVSWVEGDQSFRVTTSGIDRLGTDELIRVARSLATRDITTQGA